MQRTGAPNIGSAHLLQQARGYWRARFHATRAGVESFLERERGQLPLWLVAGFAAGIASWFTLDGDKAWLAVILMGGGTAVAGFILEGGRLERAVGWLGLSAALGCGLIWLRSEWVAAPRLERPVVSTFSAQVRQVEPMAAKGAVRLTLKPDDPALPASVRVTMKSEGAPEVIAAGAKIRLRAPRRRWLFPEPSISRGMPGSEGWERLG